MLNLRNSLIRTLPVSSSSTLAARSSRSFVSIVSPSTSTSSASASCYSGCRTPQRTNIFAITLRRSYATDGEDKPTKETFTEEVKEAAGNVMGAVQNASRTAMNYATGGDSSAPRRSYNSGGRDGGDRSSYGDRPPRRDDNSERSGDRAPRRDNYGGGDRASYGGEGGFNRGAGRDSPGRPLREEPSAEESDGTLYLANLPFTYTEQALREDAEAYGPLERFTLIKDQSGLSRGFGFAKYASPADAVAAHAGLGGKDVDGRPLVVRFSLPRDQTPRAPRDQQFMGAARERRPVGQMNPPSKTLFLGNIPYETNVEQLNVLFENCAGCLDVRVAVDRRTGSPRGFAHADFTDVTSAEAAAEWLKTQEFQGRQLKIDFATRY